MRVEKEVAPDRLDVLRVAADRQRREMIGEERHDRRASGADRIAVTGPGRAVAVEDAHDRRLLRDKALDRVGALDLGLEVDPRQLDTLDERHRSSLLQPSRARKRSVAATNSRAIPGSRAEWPASGTTTYSACAQAR